MSIELTGSANSLPAGVYVGEYLLEGVVGEGGFGIVYRARDLSLDRVVAIKEYMPSTLAARGAANRVHVRPQHKGAFDAGLRSFINEARLLAKFSHPALVHVYRFFEANGTAYMVMRYYEGETFRTALADKSLAVDERWLCAMLSPVLDVLEMLHAADCFHRDIAPDNILLDVSGMPVLLDFGAARRVIGDMTQALTMVLKPGFAPIEQYVDDGGMPQGAWTDVYQLCAMLYLAITGKPPATAVARMIKDPVGLLSVADHPGYSAKFLKGVHRGLAIRPEDRPQSVAELRGLLGIASFTISSSSAGLAADVPAVFEPVVPEPSTTALPSSADEQSVSTPLPPAFGLGTEAVSEVSGDGLTPEASAQDRAATVRSHDVVLMTIKAALGRTWRIWLPAVVLVAIVVWTVMSIRIPPDGVDALTAADNAHWTAAKSAGTSDSVQGYLSAYPQGINAAQARALLSSLAAASVNLPSATQPAATANHSNTTDASGERLPPSAVAQAPATTTSATSAPLVADKTSQAGNGGVAVLGAGNADTSARPSLTDTKPDAVVRKGVVTLRVTPWGNVRVNRSLVGTTPPLTKLDLPEGSYQIEISNPAAASRTLTVQVKSGEPVVVVHKFE